MNVSTRFVLILVAVTTIRAEVAVRILLGVGDQKQVDYSGEISSRNGRITALEPWRFDGDDKILGADRWRISTHQIRLFGGSIAPQRQWIANGIVAELAGESGDTELSVRTAQGNFTVRLSEIPFGRKVPALAGKALVRLVLKDDRVVGEERLLTELNARIRGVNQGPDGSLYVLTDGNGGKILRLVPKP